MSVKLRSVYKRFGDTQVIHGVDLDVNEGEFCVFVGPSGCGKSTLLRMIAGLEDTSDGQIMIGDEDVTARDPSERGVAMVFQTYALYPHMTVAENMGFGLKMTGHPKAEITEKVNRAADILKLGPYLDRRPKALSGGQRQRVAIGRAIVRGPKVFLFDEPLSNLDAELRVEMRVELSRLHQELGVTMIYVTHDQVEAMTLADKIVVLRGGKVEQVGAPLTLYDQPDNQFVAGFIGSPAMNFMNATASDGSVNLEQLGISALPVKTNGAITIGIRPEHIQITDGGPAKIDLVEHLGGVSYMHVVAPDGTRLVAEARDGRHRKPGDAVAVGFDVSAAYIFDPNSHARIIAH